MKPAPDLLATPATPAIIAPSVWPDTMGLEQAAGYLRLGRDATRDLWEKGELPGVSLNQKHLVFRRTALDAFLARKEQEQQQARQRRPAPASGATAKPTEPKASRSPPDLERYESKP